MSPDASVIFTGETHGHQPAAYWGGYAVAKSGLETLTKIWSDEFEKNLLIRFNTLIPGPVATAFRARTHPGQVADLLPQAASLMPQYLYMMGADSRAIRSQIIECQA
jgi:NAD(P)-dependent dehydrogenase (short-subunit alcohol dehydrogenase family)